MGNASASLADVEEARCVTVDDIRKQRATHRADEMLVTEIMSILAKNVFAHAQDGAKPRKPP